MSDDFHSSAWYRATTLAERLATLRAAPPHTGTPPDEALARATLQRWRSQPPFRGTDFFSQRLATQGLGEDELLLLLAEDAGAVAARSPVPAWLDGLASAFAGLSEW